MAYTGAVQRCAVVALVLISAACGESGNSAITSQPIGVALREGPYTLRVNRTTAALCFSLGSGPGSSVALDMTVSLASDGWRVGLADSSSGDLALTLVRQGSQLTGRGLGRGTAAAVTLVLNNALTGGADGIATHAAGLFAGNLSYSGAEGSTVCTENSWTLTPR